MKTSKNIKSQTQDIDFLKLAATVMNYTNGTSAGLSALQASILRGKELTK